MLCYMITYRNVISAVLSLNFGIISWLLQVFTNIVSFLHIYVLFSLLMFGLSLPHRLKRLFCLRFRC